MKKFIVCGAVMLALTSCGGGWSSADKEEMKKNCLESTTSAMGEAKAKDYCDCLGDKIAKKYDTKAKADAATEAEVTAMSADCIK